MSSINFSPSSSLSRRRVCPFSKKEYCIKLERTLCHTLSMIWVRSQKTRRRLTIQRLFILVKLCRERSSFCKKLTLHVNVGHTGQPGCKTFNSQSPRTSSFPGKVNSLARTTKGLFLIGFFAFLFLYHHTPSMSFFEDCPNYLCPSPPSTHPSLSKFRVFLSPLWAK